MSENQPNKPVIVTDLSEYRKAAHEYYCTPEFLDKFRELNALIMGIREKLSRLTVATDIEGTLVSLNMTYHSNGNTLQVMPHDRVRRPLANEWIVLLRRYCKRAPLWTGAGKERMGPILKSSRLDIPYRTEIIHRDDYRERLISGDHQYLLHEDEIGPHARHAAGYGTPKIPLVMDVDYLIDDYAQKDRKALGKLGEKEARKVIDIPEFRIYDSTVLANHHLDTGLIDAARALVEKVNE